MKKKITKEVENSISEHVVQNTIRFIRQKKVILDRDLAKLYGVETKVLNQAVRRNIKRFPEDFMFQLSKLEFENWKSQFVTSNSDIMGLRKLPFAFTEQGVAMLSGLLNSLRAIEVNIAIMRAFVKLRAILLANKELAHKFTELEGKVGKHDGEIRAIFEAIRRLMTSTPVPSSDYKRSKIGFIVDSKEPLANTRQRQR